MRTVIQRSRAARVDIDGVTVGQIPHGMVILVAFTDQDTQEQIDWMSRKIAALRIFADEQGQMNLSIDQTHGHVLVVSQFTLYGNVVKGNRPSFIGSAPGPMAEPLYNQFVQAMRNHLGDDRVATGEFGADMQVHLINDGPVTLIIDR